MNAILNNLNQQEQKRRPTQQDFLQIINNMDNKTLMGFVEIARKKGISEADISEGLKFIRGFSR